MLKRLAVLLLFVGIGTWILGCSEDDSGTDDNGESDTDTTDTSPHDTEPLDTETGSSTGDTDSVTTGPDTDSTISSDSDSDSGTDISVDTGTDTDTGSDTGLQDTDSAIGGCVDLDSDGWCLPFDCNDEEAAINPGQSEDTDNQIDDDCDSEVDELPQLYDWDMYLAVDNQFDVYFGTPYHTTGSRVGQGTDWTQEYHYTAEDRGLTDYLYVATTSDRSGAQGFLGVFTNTTTNKTTKTSDPVWEVFPAGAYESTCTADYWDTDVSECNWPISQLPTQEQVDAAITYAETNNLWVLPFSEPVFDNDQTTDPTDGTAWTWNPWYHDYPNIPDDALWIWHDSGNVADGNIPGPFRGGNHDEFLIFRVAGAVPEID